MERTMRRDAQTAAGAALLAVLLGGCSGIPANDETAGNKAILASCVSGEKVAGLATIDATGSSKSGGLDADRLNAIEDLASRVALCDGTLKVSAFTSSSAATVTLFEGQIPLVGATDTARARRAPKAIKKVMAEVKAEYSSAAKNLTAGGSDIIGQFRLSREYASQLGDGYRLRLLVLTDGFQNEGIDVATAARSAGGTARAAAQFEMPELPGAVVTVAGVGKVDGPAPPTTVVDGLKAFYETLCKRTKASTCTVVTDLAKGR